MSDYSDDEDLLVNESAKEAEDEEKYVKIVSYVPCALSPFPLVSHDHLSRKLARAQKRRS